MLELFLSNIIHILGLENKGLYGLRLSLNHIHLLAVLRKEDHAWLFPPNEMIVSRI